MPRNAFGGVRKSTPPKRQWSHESPKFPPDRAAQRYMYKPLDSWPAKNEIRLLTILPAAKKTDPLRCTIFHASLDNAPPYQALSYSWGDSSVAFPVYIDDSEIAVTVNLRQALRRLRPMEGQEPIVLWIDAICINQQNIPERSVQTGKMRSIYRRAERVIIWLGEESSGSVQALMLAKKLNACREEDVEALLLGTLKAGHYEDIENLVSLFRRQYWWRIWVIQEVSCSRDSIVVCGDVEIPFQDLQRVCDIMSENIAVLEKKIFFKHLSKIYTLTNGGPRSLQLSRFSANAPSPPLTELLLSHKSKKSTDPRDKVFALVGISDSRYSFGEIDYSLSVESVFIHTACHIITTAKRLDIICVKQHNLKQFNLPSWVPDWTRLPKHSGKAHLGLHHHEPPYKAAGDTEALVTFSKDGLRLQAEGFILGQVKTAGLVYKKKGDPGDVDPVLPVFTDWRDIFLQYNSASIASSVEFGKVISCGNWDFGSDSMYVDKLDSIYKLSILKSDGESTDHGRDYRLDLQQRNDATASIVSASLMMDRRRLIISDSHLSGLAPWDTCEGDNICILFGCRFLVILRKVEENYVLMGEAYISGYMDGDAIRELRDGRFQKQVFDIV